MLLFRCSLIMPILLLSDMGHGFSAPAEPYSGPASGLKILETLPITGFKTDLPTENAAKVLRLRLSDAIALTDAEKRGIPGGGGVRLFPVPVKGDLLLRIPWKEGLVDWSAIEGEIRYVGGSRISFRGQLSEDPVAPLQMKGDALSGTLIFPYEVKEPHEEKKRAGSLAIRLNLVIGKDTYGYVPDTDPSIPFWRADKSKPIGRIVTGDWETTDELAGKKKLSGSLQQAGGSFQSIPLPGRFFPIQSMELSADPQEGMHFKAYAAPVRVESGESQWAVKELDGILDLRGMNGLRLRVRSECMAGVGWKGPAPVAAALALRVKGSGWYACRTAAPLMGGEQSSVVDFQLFERGTANPGYRAGPNIHGFLDLSQIDAVAVGVANPFGVGTVEFTALNLEAVRFREAGNGVAVSEPAQVIVESGRKDFFNGVGEVPKGLFGYHLANFNMQSKDKGPSWFENGPVNGDGLALLRLCKPGYLRPLDHTSMQGSQGSATVKPLTKELAEAAAAADSVVHTVTNENLWARPRWMDEDLDKYTAGIREMFVQLGKRGYSPEQPDNTLKRIEFWNEPFMWARHINRGESRMSAGPGDPGGNRGKKAWNDPTQFSFVPAHLGAEMYARFFNAAAEGLQESNPYMQIGGMSSPAFGDDFCSVLKDYVGVFLEKSKDHLHFLTEHHYSGLPQRYAADYEIMTGYTMAEFGKSWPIWNTETNDLDDIAPGDQRSAEAAKAYTEMNRVYYNYRDILEMILKSRDKAAGRALHALWNRGWFQNKGEYELYRHTSDLRGSLLVSHSKDPAVIPVAVHHQGDLFVYILNDSLLPRQVELLFPGMKSSGPVEASGLRLAEDDSETLIGPSETSSEQKDQGIQIHFKNPLKSREIAKLVLRGVAEPSSPPRQVRQYFSDITLADMEPGKVSVARVNISEAMIHKVASARIRLVARDVQTGEFKMVIGKIEVVVPATTSEGAHHRIVEIELPGSPADWMANGGKEGMSVEIRCAEGFDGFSVYTLSLLVEEKTE